MNRLFVCKPGYFQIVSCMILAIAIVSTARLANSQSSSAATTGEQESVNTDNSAADDFQEFFSVDLTQQTTPRGLPDIPDFSSSEQLKHRIELGRQLFFDKMLSADNSTSCATCHLPNHAFSTPDALPKGVGGKTGRRNPPALVNRAFSNINFWDGRADTLETQALQPIENELEMANTVEAVLKNLRADADYQEKFQLAFDDGLTRENMATAIASFERTLISGNSRIDEFVTANESGLTKSERQGLWLYESKGGCWQCHSGKNYTDESFHNTGVSWGKQPLDLGRFEVTEQEEHKGQFKTPTLRDVALSGPYMHDGSIKTLREVIDFYDRGGNPNPHLDAKLKPLNLSEQEKQDLVAFLKALTGRHVWDRPSGDPPADQEK